MSRVTRVNHIGVPVSDLARSVEWYEEVLDIAPTGVTIAATNPSLGAVVEVENPSMRASFALAGDNVLLELIQYDSPQPKPFAGRNCDVGVMHLCFEVDDLEAAHRDLVGRGVHVNATRSCRRTAMVWKRGPCPGRRPSTCAIPTGFSWSSSSCPTGKADRPSPDRSQGSFPREPHRR